MVGLSFGLWVGGGVTVVASLLLAPALLALAARTERDRAALAPTVARLRRLGLFTEASDAALERVARAVETVTVDAGDTVITEGDPPDDLFVIDSGELVVHSRGDSDGSGEHRGQGREVNHMGPDDWFGEIGLLRGIPRTATVTAVTQCDLLRVPGQVFVDALGTPDALPDPVRRMITTRLNRTHPGSAEPR